MVSAAEIPPEILVSIFKYSQYHKDLLNFALVCRSWTDWAIDVGWRTCEAPLSKVLAVLDLRNERDPIFDDDADWTKFVVISNKVTRVKCDFRLKPSEVANFDKRRKENDGGAPFQNVLELIVNMNFSDFRTASIVCSPESPKSIRMYRAPIGGSTDGGWVDQSIPRLSFASCAPSVESISVAYPSDCRTPSLHRFAQLRVVECYLLAVQLFWWEDLAACPRLTDLRLRPTIENPLWMGGPQVVFPALEKFHYTTRTKSKAPDVIIRSSFPVLRHCVIHPCPLPNPVEIITAHLRDHSPLLQEFLSAEDYVAQE